MCRLSPASHGPHAMQTGPPSIDNAACAACLLMPWAPRSSPVSLHADRPDRAADSSSNWRDRTTDRATHAIAMARNLCARGRENNRLLCTNPELENPLST
jgi:hypothetical protein